MMKAISAVYTQGVFTPQRTLELPEHQQVQLIVIYPEPTARPKQLVFSHRKQAMLNRLEALVAKGLFDLMPLPEDIAREYLKQPVFLTKVRASLEGVPGEYVDRLLEAEREEN